MQPTSSIRKILIAAFCCLACAYTESALAVEGDLTPSKIAVVALMSEEDPSETLKMAEGVYRKLSAYEQFEVLPVDEVRRLLRGPGFIEAPTEDLEKLRGLYQGGYLDSYSFKYQEAIEKLRKVVKGLERAPDSPARWDLFVNAHIYIGKSLVSLKKKKEALDAFKMVLRSRPDMALSRKEHPVKDIDLWEKARAQMEKAPKGKLVLDTEPSGAEVFLDGAKVGGTPFIGEFPRGRYHMRLHHKGTGLSYARWFEVGEKMTRSRIDLAFESSLLTGLSHLAIRLPEGKNEIPLEWWPWMGERLGVSRVASIRMVVDEGKKYWEVSLVGARNGEDIRECRGKKGVADEDPLAVDLARFLVTGQVKDGMVLTVRPKGDKYQHENPARLKITPGIIVTEKPTQPTAPWYRKWWPYAVGGAVLLGGGVAANLVANDYYEDTGGLSSKQDAADTWMGVAIGGYMLAGVSIIMGIVLDATWDEGGSSQELLPVAGAGELGLMWVFRF